MSTCTLNGPRLLKHVQALMTYNVETTWDSESNDMGHGHFKNLTRQQFLEFYWETLHFLVSDRGHSNFLNSSGRHYNSLYSTGESFLNLTG